MSETIKQLREEHLNIAKILQALEYQLAIFDNTEQPDYDVLTAIADYFSSFPDRCHHPKEDLVYRKMCERNPSLAQQVTNLEAEHEKISALALHFQEAVRNVLKEVEVPRSAFSEIAHNFLAEQRGHMQTEEDEVFPLAQQILSNDDWIEIDERISREEDPVFASATSREFETLRETILKWEEEDEARES